MILMEHRATSDAGRMREKRAQDKDLEIPACKSPGRRAEAEQSARAWLRTYGPAFYQGELSPQINILIDAYHDILTYGGDQALAATRGIGKSTLITWLTVCYALRGLLDCTLLIGQNGEKADQNMVNIKGVLEGTSKDIARDKHGSHALREDYPEIWLPVQDVRTAPNKAKGQTANRVPTDIQWGANQIVLPTIPGFKGSGSVIASMTIESGDIRGFNHLGLRPQLVVIDDPETRESAASDKEIENREQVIEADIAELGTPERPVARLMLTTIQNRKCVSWRFTDSAQKPSFSGKRFAFLKTWPERKDLWARYVSMRRQDQQGFGGQPADKYSRRACQFMLDNFTEMHAGAEWENDLYDRRLLRDGTQRQYSPLQRLYDVISDRGEDGYRFVLTEWQNDPPEDDENETGKLTPDEVASRLNGANRGDVPEDVETLVCQIDLHMHWHYYTVMSTSQNGTVRDVVDYGLELVPIADEVGADNAIRSALDKLADQLSGKTWTTAEGRIVPLDLGVVDAGFKQSIGVEFVTERKGIWRLSKGMGSGQYKTKPRSADIRPGEHWHDSRQPACEESDGRRWWLIEPDTDYWLHQVHSGFRAMPFLEDGKTRRRPGSIALFGNEPEIHLTNVDRTVARSMFAVQICGWLWEQVTTKIKGTYMAWVPQWKQDHWLDTTYGCLVADQVARELPAVKERLRPRPKRKEQPEKNFPEAPSPQHFRFLSNGERPRLS